MRQSFNESAVIARAIAEAEAKVRSARLVMGTVDLLVTIPGTASRRPGTSALYRLDADHRVEQVLPGVTMSNGLGWSPDHRTFYYVDSAAQRLDAFDHDPDSGRLGGRRPLVSIPAEVGIPDGLSVDADGCVWLAVWGAGSIHRYTPAGVLDGASALLSAPEVAPMIAGIVIGSFAVGGIVYSIGIGTLLRLLGQKWVMIAGGLLMSFGIAGLAFTPTWQVQCVLVGLMGLGFYMLHASIQVFVTELAPATRSSAIAFHTFSIFIGQSIGTVAFGYGLTWLGSPTTLAVCAIAIALTGIVSTQLLMRPKPI